MGSTATVALQVPPLLTGALQRYITHRLTHIFWITNGLAGGALSPEGSEALLKAGRVMVVLLGLSFTDGLGSRDDAG